jgi:hypothetical protein
LKNYHDRENFSHHKGHKGHKENQSIFVFFFMFFVTFVVILGCGPSRATLKRTNWKLKLWHSNKPKVVLFWTG